MPKITKRPKEERPVIQAKTKDKPTDSPQTWKWWEADSQKGLVDQLLSTAVFLKQSQGEKMRQAAVYSRLYSNQPIFNFAGSSLQRMGGTGGSLPVDRPTMNVVQSCVDTLVSRVTQSKPRPYFLTDNGDYKKRQVSKIMNSFISGEFYRLEAYRHGAIQLRDAAVIGDGYLHVFPGPDDKVAIERLLKTDLLWDPNDSFYGAPMNCIRYKSIDRELLKSLFPEVASRIDKASNGFTENDGDVSRSMADQIPIVEGWRLATGSGKNNGRHSVVCSEGILFDEPDWDKTRFPFTRLPFSPRLVGVDGQALTEQLMGTQVEINKLLITISRSINLVGVPRVFVEDGSKVVKAHLNNEIGSIVTYRGTKPQYEVAPCVPAEVYAQLQRLVQYAYEQSGVSALSASAQKPAGLNSGEAIKSYDDLQTDRFAALSSRYHDTYIDLAYLVIETAKDIAKETGSSYTTVAPSKNGTEEVTLPDLETVKEHPWVIQCYDTSFLPKDPSGRLDKITTMMQAGLLSPQEGRRLLDFPDLEQVEALANAPEERILKYLDEIIYEGKYTGPDPFTDLDKALELVVQYYNLHVAKGLSDERANMLRTYFTQVNQMRDTSQQPPPMPGPPGAPAPGGPQGVPPARPTNELLSNMPQPQS